MVFRRQMVAKWAGMLEESQVVWGAVNLAANANGKEWHFEHTLDRTPNYWRLFSIRGNYPSMSLY